jgi:hypothetical protein
VESRPSNRAVAERERKLRETVTQATGCLDDLSRGQRRVLTLRAGIGAGPPRSRSSTARRLDISVKRVTRLERTGLKRLRELAHGGGCAPPPTTTSATTTVAAGAPASAPAMSPGEAEREGGGGGKKPSREAERPATGGVDTPEDEAPSSSGVAGLSQTNRPGENGGMSFVIPLILLVLLLAAVLLARMLRRQATPVPVGEAPAPEEPARPVWIPWRRSTMTGPSWNEAPPPSREDSWAESPSKAPEPEPQHEPWTAPRTKRPVR